MPDIVVSLISNGQSRWLSLSGNARGAVWILLSALFFAAMAGLIKDLGRSLHSLEIVFFRCFIGLIVTLPFVLHTGLKTLRLTRPGLHVARALVGCGSMFCSFYAVAKLPLAAASALTYTKPLFMIPLAVVFLGEIVRWRRWTATIVGFLGVLVMLRPGAETIQAAALIGLLGAMFVALVVVIVKKLSATESPLTILLTFGAFTSLFSLPVALLVWKTPTAEEMVKLIALGTVASVGQYCALRGIRAGEATALVPFDYSHLVFAALIGFLTFGEVPDPWTVAGASIIVASTFYIGYREARGRV